MYLWLLGISGVPIVMELVSLVEFAFQDYGLTFVSKLPVHFRGITATTTVTFDCACVFLKH